MIFSAILGVVTEADLDLQRHAVLRHITDPRRRRKRQTEAIPREIFY